MSISAIKTLATPLAQQASPVILAGTRENAFAVPITIGLEAFASTNAMLRLIAMVTVCATLMQHQRKIYVFAIKTGMVPPVIFIAMIRKHAMIMENVRGYPTQKFALAIKIMLAKTVNTNAAMTKRVMGKVFVELMENVYAMRAVLENFVNTLALIKRHAQVTAVAQSTTPEKKRYASVTATTSVRIVVCKIQHALQVDIVNTVLAVQIQITAYANLEAMEA